MKVTVLVENSTISNKYRKKHGLSLLIESIDESILFDLGQTYLYRQNAEKLGADLNKVNHVVISHGHNDHIGGLKYIPESLNTYIHAEALNPLYARLPFGLKINIGLDNKYKSSKNITLTKDLYKISDRLQLFSDVVDTSPKTDKQDYLLVLKDGELQIDDFKHEQHLLINEKNKNI